MKPPFIFLPGEIGQIVQMRLDGELSSTGAKELARIIAQKRLRLWKEIVSATELVYGIDTPR